MGEGYRYLDDVAIADIAFQAWGSDLDRLFYQAARATAEIMVDDLGTVRREVRRSVDLAARDPEMALFDLLQELVYYKDAESLILVPESVTVTEGPDEVRVQADLVGEPFDPARHPLNADVKAVTLHRFSVRRTGDAWGAEVVLDI